MANTLETLPGDNWAKVAAREGESEQVLMDANPNIGYRGPGESFPPGTVLYMPNATAPEDAPEPEPPTIEPVTEMVTPVDADQDAIVQTVVNPTDPAVNPTDPTAGLPVPQSPADPINPSSLLALYNQGSNLADRLHTFLVTLAPVVGQ